jgi:hypothetical protein
MELIVVSLASLLAGFVDSIVGGGGLILVPALFAIFPTTHPATLFGTNKGASVWGTALPPCNTAARVNCHGTRWPRPQRVLSRPWRRLAGDRGLTRLPAQDCCPWSCCLVWLYTLAKKELGRDHRTALCRPPKPGGLRNRRSDWFLRRIFWARHGQFLCVFAGAFAGLRLSCTPRPGPSLLNTASNLAAILLFTLKGHVWWHFVLAMAMANVLGSLAGTHLALNTARVRARRVHRRGVGADSEDQLRRASMR